MAETRGKEAVDALSGALVEVGLYVDADAKLEDSGADLVRSLRAAL